MEWLGFEKSGKLNPNDHKNHQRISLFGYPTSALLNDETPLPSPLLLVPPPLGSPCEKVSRLLVNMS